MGFLHVLHQFENEIINNVFAIYLCAITCYRGDCGFPKRNVAYKRSVA